MIVYKYTNRNNGKVYIGITTKSLKERHRQHLKSLNDGTYFHNAIKKHGIKAFDLEVIDETEFKEDLGYLEQYYIEYYNSFAYKDGSNGYNCTLGGEGLAGLCGELNSQYGISPKERMGEENYKKWLEKIKNPSDETRRKISEVWKGNQYFLGKKHSDATKKHFSKIRKGKPAKNKIEVEQYNKDGTFIKKHQSMTEALKEITDSESLAAICLCCKGKRKTAYGYIWKYVE